jgi:hypothetical protein
VFGSNFKKMFDLVEAFPKRGAPRLEPAKISDTAVYLAQIIWDQIALSPGTIYKPISA